MTDMLQITNLHKTFNPGTPNENHVLKGVSLTLKEGDYVTLSAEMALESPLCSTASPVPSGWIPARSASIRWM